MDVPDQQNLLSISGGPREKVGIYMIMKHKRKKRLKVLSLCLLCSGVFLCSFVLYRFGLIPAFTPAGISNSLKSKLPRWSKAGPIQNKRNITRHLASYGLYTNEVESRAQKMMEKARSLHHTGSHPSANKILAELLKTYPYAGYREEASFLLAKGLFHEGEYRRSERVIQSLRDYDIHSKWLGRSLLILANIQERKGNRDETFRLYDYVIKEFSEYPEVINEAQNALPETNF